MHDRCRRAAWYGLTIFVNEDGYSIIVIVELGMKKLFYLRVAMCYSILKSSKLPPLFKILELELLIVFLVTHNN